MDSLPPAPCSTTTIEAPVRMELEDCKVRDSLELNNPFKHLPESERFILESQLHLPTATTNFLSLYKYATTWDRGIIAVSSTCAICGGAVMPLMTVRSILCLISDGGNI